ncbi:MAG: TorF family putative porin [Pseudomarimonas sp.]
MSRITLRPLALACLILPLAGFAGVAQAQDESPFTWNAAVTTDYVFRGVSQTDEDPALQLGADYGFGSGFYVGVWASNVDFGSEIGADVELDTYVGWAKDFNENVNLDISLLRYNYFGTSSGIDLEYNELITTLGTGPVSFTLGYTNDIYASDTDSFYYQAAAGFTPGGGDFGIDFGVGRTTFESELGLDDYTDYFISASYPLGPFSAALGYYDNDSSGDDNFGEVADGRLVFTLSIEG